MKQIIQFTIEKEDNIYTAQGVELAIVTQGKTMEELMSNIKEAVELHLEGENLSELGLSSQPAILINFELTANLCRN